MTGSSIPISEVILNTESSLHRVLDVRRRALELLDQAARLQEEAFRSVINELGEQDGAMAYRLACRSIGVDPELRDGAKDQGPQPRPVPVQTTASVPVVHNLRTTETEPHFEDEKPASSKNIDNRVQIDRPDRNLAASSLSGLSEVGIDPSRVNLYGVSVKRNKISEANEVIEQAKSAHAQKRKTNPFSEDRGRNAWRSSLFSAVLSKLSETDSDLPQQADIKNDSFGNEDNSVSDILDDAEPASVSSTADASMSAHMTIADDIMDSASQRPSVPSRAVVFTKNPVQAGPRTFPQKSPSPVRTAAPSKESQDQEREPQVHVVRPVTDRTVAHGQAVPMPEGLKEAIQASGKEPEPKETSQPIIKPAPPAFRRAPTFLKR